MTGSARSESDISDILLTSNAAFTLSFLVEFAVIAVGLLYVGFAFFIILLIVNSRLSSRPADIAGANRRMKSISSSVG